MMLVEWFLYGRDIRYERFNVRFNIDAVSKIESCGNLYYTIKLRTQSKLYEQL